MGFCNGKIALWLKLLTSTKLPHTFWFETIITTSYIQNYCYTCLILDKTPFELWVSMQPNLCHLCASNALHMNMCQMKNDKSLTPKHKNASLLTLWNLQTPTTITRSYVWCSQGMAFPYTTLPCSSCFTSKPNCCTDLPNTTHTSNTTSILGTSSSYSFTL